jgi:sulfotransferase family protein
VSAGSAPPIFVIGAPRSGTTLLRVMLSSHPRIYIPPESDFIPRLFLGRARVPMSRRRALRNVRIVLDNRRFLREWRGAPLDADSFVDDLDELTPAAFLDALYGTYAAGHGAARWGDKSPIYTHYVPLLAEIFPAARFVHLIRDGRDAALSALAAYRDRFYVDIYFAARSWEHRVRAARVAGARLGPDRYVELRYEELTVEPEAALRPLCAFLGERYEPAMREPQRLGRDLLRLNRRHAPVREPPHANSGAWRARLAPADQRLFHAVAAGLLADLGYDAADPGPLAPSERARLARLAGKYRALEGGRRVLQTFGVFHPH